MQKYLLILIRVWRAIAFQKIKNSATNLNLIRITAFQLFDIQVKFNSNKQNKFIPQSKNIKIFVFSLIRTCISLFFVIKYNYLSNWWY